MKSCLYLCVVLMPTAYNIRLPYNLNDERCRLPVFYDNKPPLAGKAPSKYYACKVLLVDKDIYSLNTLGISYHLHKMSYI